MKHLKVLAICCLGLLVMGACGGNNNDDLNYKKACAENDYVKAHQILDKLKDRFVKKGLPELTNWWNTPNISDLTGYQDYVDADMYIFREEVTYLLSLDDPAANSRIIKLLMETTQFYGTAPEEGKHIMSEGWNEYVNPYWMYYYCLLRYNQKCDVILEMSILFKNESLAKSILSSYKETIHVVDHVVHFDNKDRDNASRKYYEAVNNGVFI